jgi:hypothetical protein
VTRALVRSAVLAAALLGCARAGGRAQAPARTELPPRAHRAFHHPGLLSNASELEALRRRVAAGQDRAFEAMKQSPFASLDWRPAPRRTVFCGPYSRPDVGCREEKNDATAAYTHALLWAATGNEAHARKAAEILDAWSSTLAEHTGHNAPLQSAWVASLIVRAAELIRHTSPVWPAEGVARFSRLLENAYLPYVVGGMPDYNGNWELSMIEATMAAGVFLDDGALFDRAVAMWRKRVPAYFYLRADGTRPVAPPGTHRYDEQGALVEKWYGQSRFVDGLCQETCRDFGHTMYGLAAAVNAAEIAFHQSVDLYAEEARRLTAALEFHAAYLLGQPAPPWLCGGRLNLRRSPTGEIAYHHFHDRRGVELPLTARLIEQRRPSGTDHHMAWESFTHGGLE